MEVWHIMRKDYFENLILTGQSEGKRDRKVTNNLVVN